MMEEEHVNLNPMQVSETQFTGKLRTPLHDVENNVEDKSEKETACTQSYSIFRELCQTYVQLLVTVAAVAVFTEILHGPVPLFHIHVYIYLYLLSVSILIFVWSFMSRLKYRFNDETYHETWEYHLYHTKYIVFGLIVYGLATSTCTSLKSAAVFSSEPCISSMASALYVLNTVFSIFQLLFFCSKSFNYVSRFKNFFIVHLAATNAALWLYMVLWESSADWQHELHLTHNSKLSWSKKDLNITVHSIERDFSPINQSHFPKHVVHFTSNCWWHVLPDSDFSADIASVNLCLQNSTVGMMWQKTSEYLYPFMIQYYLIALFLLCILWRSMTIECKYTCSSLIPVKVKKCFCISKGFYLGFIYFITSILIVILYFIQSIANFDIVVMSMLIIIYASAGFAVLVGMCQMKSVTREGSLNQNFLNGYHKIGLYFIYVYGALNLFVGSLSEDKYVSLFLIVEALLMIFHGVSQYIFIKSMIKSRQAVNFLILCNASLWILESFLFCYSSPKDIQLKIYGIAWSIMTRIIVPCLAFYRYHTVLLLLNISRYLSDEYH